MLRHLHKFIYGAFLYVDDGLCLFPSSAPVCLAGLAVSLGRNARHNSGHEGGEDCAVAAAVAQAGVQSGPALSRHAPLVCWGLFLVEAVVGASLLNSA